MACKLNVLEFDSPVKVPLNSGGTATINAIFAGGGLRTTSGSRVFLKQVKKLPPEIKTLKDEFRSLRKSSIF